ncbi:MAG: glycosyltransferase family 4 protein [Kiritimatiellae bacterium]|nr:glycosyltransferase family 4 protein [Kiritimatiellia bacterium]
MNVWIINPFDNLPSEGYRPMRFWLMAESFARHGANVVYWTSDFSHANKKKRVKTHEVFPPFKVVELPALEYKRNVSFKRIRSHLKLAKDFARIARLKKASGELPELDLIVASSPPLSLVREAHRFAREVGAKVIVDVMDAWPETFERIVPKWMLWSIRQMAKINYLQAAAITTVAKRYCDLVRAYGYSGDVRLFYHGIELSKEAPQIKSVVSSLKVVYAGSLGRSYDLATAIKAIGQMKGAAVLDIAGKGEREEELKKLAESLPQGLVRFHGYLPKDDLDALLRSADIGLVPMDGASCVGVPYKFADYAKYALPIASSLGGESAELLKSFGAGAEYAFGDADSLEKALFEIAEDLTSFKAASLKMAEEKLDAAKIYDEYVRFARNLSA